MFWRDMTVRLDVCARRSCGGRCVALRLCCCWWPQVAGRRGGAWIASPHPFYMPPRRPASPAASLAQPAGVRPGALIAQAGVVPLVAGRRGETRVYHFKATLVLQGLG
jgi:hypothetical protein